MGQVLTTENEIGINKPIEEFFNRLENGDYKVILYNGQMPLMKDNLAESMIELITNDLDRYSKIELISNDAMVIHTGSETIELKGYKDMSDGEIFARQYLDTCEYEDLIVKDSLEQDEFRDDNFKDTKDYYNRCKYITTIRTVPEDSEHYNMNWDCIIVGFEDDDNFFEQIWQRA